MSADPNAGLLVVGGRIRCPKDKQLRNMLAYKHFQIESEYAGELNVVLKCPGCGHIFSPGLSTSEMKQVLHDAA